MPTIYSNWVQYILDMIMNIKRLVLSFGILLVLMLSSSNFVLAEAEFNPEHPQQLCLPGVYLDDSPDCSVLGPSAYLTNQASIFREISTQPERYPIIDDTYGKTDTNYFQVNNNNTNYFSTYETALNNTLSSGSLYKGYTFAAYTQVETVNNLKLYKLTNGNWMRGSAVARLAAPNRFLGVTPTGETERLFGWVLKDTPTLQEPGYYMPKTGNTIPRHTLVEVFDQEKIGLSDWYMVRPNEWVHMTQVALVYPAPEKPEGWKADRWIEINLWEQTLSIFEKDKMVYATLITTGTGNFYTRPGLFKIYEKLDSTSMAANIGQDGAYFLMDVPWTMYFDERRALHAEYWHDNLGYKSSHGCVNLSFPDAEWIFNWGKLGDWVYVWDPTGQTPEERRLFTQHLGDN